MKKISITEIEILFEKIINRLKLELGDDGIVKTETIIYRSIPSNKWNKFEKNEDWFSADEISQGDLDDDIDELKKLINNTERPCTYVDFDRTASLLKEMSQIYNPI